MVACGILIPQPGIESMPPALKGGVLTTGMPGSPQSAIFTTDFPWGYLCWHFCVKIREVSLTFLSKLDDSFGVRYKKAL